MDMTRHHQKGRTSRKGDKRLIVIVAACIIVVTVVLVISLSGRGSAVTFPDPNLEAEIREAIGKPAGHIYESDLETLTTLDAPGQLESQANIQDLSGLQYCSNLIDLNLELSTHISDLSPLSDLTDLTHIDLWHNQVSDISPLANLTRLTYLYLPRSQISDVSPLVDNEGISAGDEVYLSGNPLSSDSIEIYIPQLQARGVTVSY
jgi:Leucine-rich repeat (LRR) protein